MKKQLPEAGKATACTAKHSNSFFVRNPDVWQTESPEQKQRKYWDFKDRWSLFPSECNCVIGFSRDRPVAKTYVKP